MLNTPSGLTVDVKNNLFWGGREEKEEMDRFFSAPNPWELGLCHSKQD